MQFTTIAQSFLQISKNYQTQNFLSNRLNNQWNTYSVQEFCHKTKALTTALTNLGIKKGDYVGIMSNSNPYWLMFDFACAIIGAVSVPIFANISTKNLKYEIETTGLKTIFINKQTRWDIVHDIVEPMVDNIITRQIDAESDKIIKLEKLLETEYDEKRIENLASKVTPDDLLTIIFTSGTTGNPKGVCLSHGNLVSQIHDTRKCFYNDDGSHQVILSYLPLAHIFERMVMHFYLSCGFEIYFCDAIENLSKIIKDVRPTMMTTVPRLLEKIYGKISEKTAAATGLKGKLAKAAFARANNKDIEASKGLQDIIYNKLVYKKYREATGGRVKYMVSGGAALAPDLAQFFTNIGILILQGYGLSEASPVISSNTPLANRLGSSGKKFDSVEVKITDEGELITRGPNVMQGYYKNQEATDEVIKDGWLYTGDMAKIDDDGFIFITGRIKELFKTSTGKYISPIPIEQKLFKHDYVDMAMIVAEGRKYACAVIFPTEEAANADDLDTQIEEHIKAVNKTTAKWERIVGHVIANEPPSIEDGTLTPSMKLVRKEIEAKYKKQIDGLYKR